MTINEKRIGSDFDDFLSAQGIREEVQAAVAKSMIALQLQDELQRQQVTKSEMARRMKSSRAVVDNLLNPDNPSVTLLTLQKAAGAVGKTLDISLV
ncbi:MAG: helix-turn-helix domain-containing protein [Actinomycetes bacterium]|jgi:hypothetical protein|nr:helix-turn-helix domain-containing protein [Actinomycetes bacterium]